ncbi:hypothetical protein OQH61_08655 [Helicobacter sp. MIT 21-1697]|nr:hypothetical protein [Helicobacter sp. MIT 21-1697]MCX2717800.1 hypothetical protein [Helicobacter sp. MIT 21-1697]
MNFLHTLKSLQGQFILSYNDCALVRELYKDFRILESKEVRYSLNIKVRKRAREVIVMGC